MKIRNPYLIKWLGFIASWIIRVWISTVRFRVFNLDGVGHPVNARWKRFIYAFWHESILFPPGFRVKIHVLISQHVDGELIAQIIRHMRADLIRGSSTRGGVKALLQMLKSSKHSHLLVTPDGPRGPRRQIQLGLIFVASQTGLPIVPCGVAFDRAWYAPSWDRFAVPWPWATAYGVTGEAIFVPPKIKRKELEAYRVLVEQRMLAATAAAERWARGEGKPVPNSATERLPLKLSA